jgi:hypothetical protein
LLPFGEIKIYIYIYIYNSYSSIYLLLYGAIRSG